MESSAPLGTFHIARHQQVVDEEFLTLTCQAISKTSTKNHMYHNEQLIDGEILSSNTSGDFQKIAYNHKVQ